MLVLAFATLVLAHGILQFPVPRDPTQYAEFSAPCGPLSTNDSPSNNLEANRDIKPLWDIAALHGGGTCELNLLMNGAFVMSLATGIPVTATGTAGSSVFLPMDDIVDACIGTVCQIQWKWTPDPGSDYYACADVIIHPSTPFIVATFDNDISEWDELAFKTVVASSVGTETSNILVWSVEAGSIIVNFTFEYTPLYGNDPISDTEMFLKNAKTISSDFQAAGFNPVKIESNGKNALGMSGGEKFGVALLVILIIAIVALVAVALFLKFKKPVKFAAVKLAVTSKFKK